MKENYIIFAVVLGLILIMMLVEIVFTDWLYLLVENFGEYLEAGLTSASDSDLTSEAGLVDIFLLPITLLDNLSNPDADRIATLFSVPITLLFSLSSLVYDLLTAVPAVYYATDHCPGPKGIFSILSQRPLRYLLASLLSVTLFYTGLLLFIIPGILMVLVHPLYIHYVFTTDLDLGICLSRSFKKMFQDFPSFFVVSLICFLFDIVSMLFFLLPVFVVWPMTELYKQNYIHHKGLVSAKKLA